MKILHVVRGLTNSSGVTHIVGPMAEEQAKLGHSISVYFVEKPPFEAIRPREDLVRAECFPVTVMRKHPGISLPLARALNDSIGDFDIVHVHAVWNFPSYYAMRTAAQRQVPYMVAPQGSLEPWALAAGSALRRAYSTHVEGPLIRRADGMQALTKAEARQFEQFGFPGNISIIPNGVAPDWLQSTRASLAHDLGLAPGARTLLFLARVHPKKGLDRLLRGFALFAAEASDVILIIAGHDAGTNYLEEMKRLATDLGIAERCLFIGEISGELKRRTLAGADAFALVSHSEGLPIAVLEAMASALPVLITSNCNVPEVGDHDAGIITDPHPEAVAAGLRILLASEEGLRRRGANARRLVAQNFTWPHIAAQTLDAYAAMMDART